MKYPYEMLETKASDLLSDPHARGWVEGATMALNLVIIRLSGDSPSSKSYDPMLVDPESGKMHSYAFDMKDGGRHHPISDYDTLGEILHILTDEAIDWVKND